MEIKILITYDVEAKTVNVALSDDTRPVTVLNVLDTARDVLRTKFAEHEDGKTGRILRPELTFQPS